MLKIILSKILVALSVRSVKSYQNIQILEQTLTTTTSWRASTIRSLQRTRNLSKVPITHDTIIEYIYQYVFKKNHSGFLPKIKYAVCPRVPNDGLTPPGWTSISL